MNKKHPKGIGGIRWWHRILLPTGYTEGMVHHGPDGGDWPTTRFGMPEDLTDKTVLDVGAWDGFFSFEAEKRGTKHVLAIDISEEEGGNWGATEGFAYASRALKSKVCYTNHNIETDDMDNPIQFNVVMCYGVLYHLKAPLRAMENLAKTVMPGGMLLLETAMSNFSEGPLLEYRPGADNDPTNFFYPNKQWIETVSKQLGFVSCEMIHDMHSRATFKLIKG